MLSKYNWDNIAQENYLRNVGPQCSDIVLQENNLGNSVLNLPWANIAQDNYLCNVGPQSIV